MAQGSTIGRLTTARWAKLSRRTLLTSGAATIGGPGALVSGIEGITLTTGTGADRINTQAFIGNDTITTGRGVDNANAGDLDGTDTQVMDWSAITDTRFGISNTDLGFGWHRYGSASGDKLDCYGFEAFKLIGGADDDHLFGGALRDTLTGGGGDDVLNSSTGGGVITGGDGADRWRVDPAAAAGFNATASQATAQLTRIGLPVTGIEALDLTTGNGNDNLNMTGFAFSDTVSTQGGNDTINLGLGLDTLNGGANTDILVADYSSATTAVNQVDLGFGWARLQMACGTSRVDDHAMERFNFGAGTLVGGGTRLTSIENVSISTGSGADRVIAGPVRQ